MSEGIRSFFNWFATEHGCATLDYAGGLLLGLEYFAIILGEKRVERLNKILVETQNRLNPKNAEATARWLTFGPVAMVALLLVLVALYLVMASEIHNPRAHLLFYGDQMSADSNWSWKMFTLVFWKPLGLLGLLAGIWLSRSKQAAESFEKLIRSTFAWLFKPATSPVPNTLPPPVKEPALLPALLSVLKAFNDSMPYISIIVKFAAFVLLLTFATGFVVAKYGMLAMFHAVTFPILKLPSFILDQKRLRWIAASIGLAMLSTSYIIRMTGKK